ncbi:amylo-alpha-1,6-glucosidase [Petrotoga sp. 9PWA.NaAc.5.4]|uniref:amylo-alpha-1,6-glucosidase n=1 Tax=Petrotoga sp. 9PWA.NaAc.5.4 TaxID=1434328 RepID=UPI000CCA9344|nr:amylo-alpha-1,6-glucosidase [Petrotoga sp. 9PWA.NaAc.5.4]PNR95323.1 glycogen debranching protein [Petrotoga sp. 9PWA.NaAc.5.4]
MNYTIDQNGSITYFSQIPQEYIITNKNLTMIIKKGMPLSIFSNKYGTVMSNIYFDFLKIEKVRFYPDGIELSNRISKMNIISEPQSYSFLIKFENIKNLEFSFRLIFKKEFKLPFFDKVEIPIKYETQTFNKGIKLKDDFVIEVTKGKIKNIKKDERIVFNIESDKERIIEISIGKSGEKDLTEKNNDYINYLKKLTPQYNYLEDLEKILFLFSTHTALSSIKDFDGKLGLAAGVNYSFPNRTYFRDGFWTIQPIMKIDPQFARNEILLLSEGVHKDGSCPSGVMILGEEELEFIREKKELLPKQVKTSYRYEKDWWSNHHDSGGYYVILLSQYIEKTGDIEILKEEFSEGTILDKVGFILKRYLKMSNDKDFLMNKPFDSNDWADNVYRNGYVTYDLAIQIEAFRKAALIYKMVSRDKISKELFDKYEKMKYYFNKKMWNEEKGYFNDFIGDYCEDHLNIDTVISILFDIADNEKKQKTLFAMEKMLETKNNPDQKFGDWGVMSVWPFFKSKKHLFSKSVFPYRYHNGSDWPYLSSIYALVKRRENMDYKYPLMRWWKYSLDKGWINPVEYYSPAYFRGSLNQGWSSFAATFFL